VTARRSRALPACALVLIAEEKDRRHAAKAHRVGSPDDEPQAPGGSVRHHVPHTGWRRDPPNERQGAAGKDVEVLIKLADAVKDRTNDGKPATAELRQLVEQVARVQTFIAMHPMTTLSNWQAVQTSLATLRQAFGLTT
jgi:hypothetical protein